MKEPRHAVQSDLDASRAAGARSEFSTLESETLRLNLRYVIEVVERFGLCPWATRARLEGRVTTEVIMARSPDDLLPSLRSLELFEERSEHEIGLFVYPCLSLKRLDFEHFARCLGARHSERIDPRKPSFAVAAFHPDAQAVVTDPHRLVPFLRRTPDPTLQLVRLDALERVRGADHGTAFMGAHHLGAGLGTQSPQDTPDVRERIARQNLETVRALGVDALEAVLQDIRRDRDAVHARLIGG